MVSAFPVGEFAKYKPGEVVIFLYTYINVANFSLCGEQARGKKLLGFCHLVTELTNL